MKYKKKVSLIWEKKGKWLPQKHADVNKNADEDILFLLSVQVQQNVCVGPQGAAV